MSVPEDLQYALRRLELYVAPIEFHVIAAYLRGYDHCSSGGVLVGFREWLVVKLGFGNNFVWTELALRLIFPETDRPRESLARPNGQEVAVKMLVELVEEFWRDREAPDGLRLIYLKYQKWLEHQSWYEPQSPLYIAY